MADDAFKQARQAGYAAGYGAGRRRAKRDASERRRHAQENALWQRALLAALPFAWSQNNWKTGDKPISTMEERARFVANIADAALSVALGRGRVGP